MNILVTGANEGIGYCMVEKLLSQGHCVTVLDIEINNLINLSKTYPDKILPVLCDVRSTESIQSGIKQCADAYGTIDIAVHNACKCSFNSFEETDYSVYEDILNVNYFGALRLAKCVLPYIKKGRVIFVSSGVGVTGFHNISPYASSKGAIEALAKCLAIEYKDKGVSFHIMHPPLTNTKSATPIAVPKEFLADPKTVGCGLAKNINKKGFYICHSVMQQFQLKLCYLFPLKMGGLMSKMAKRAHE